MKRKREEEEDKPGQPNKLIKTLKEVQDALEVQNQQQTIRQLTQGNSGPVLFRSNPEIPPHIEYSPDQLEQIDLISKENSVHPILIGASIKQEVEKPKKSDKKGLAKFRATQEKINAGVIKLYELGDEAKSYVLNSEKYLSTHAEWSIEINIAFIIGAIRSRKQIKLVTDWEHYRKMGEGILNNGTFWELLALKRCGYNFNKDAEGKIIAAPGGNIKEEYENIVSDVFNAFKTLNDQMHQHMANGNYNLLKTRFPEYRNEVEALINLFEHAPQIENTEALKTATSSSHPG